MILRTTNLAVKKKKKLVAQNMINPVVTKRKKSVSPIVINHVAQQKADTEEIDSNNIILENEVVEDDII